MMTTYPLYCHYRISEDRISDHILKYSVQSLYTLLTKLFNFSLLSRQYLISVYCTCIMLLSIGFSGSFANFMIYLLMRMLVLEKWFNSEIDNYFCSRNYTSHQIAAKRYIIFLGLSKAFGKVLNDLYKYSQPEKYQKYIIQSKDSKTKQYQTQIVKS